MKPVRLSLTLKIFLGTAAIVLVVLGATLAVTARSAGRAADAAVTRGLSAAREVVIAQLNGRDSSLLGQSRVFVSNGPFRSLIETYGVVGLSSVQDLSLVAVNQIGADWVQILDRHGVRLAKSDDPGATNDTLIGSPLVQSALSGEARAAFGSSGDSALVQLAAVPIEGAGEGVIVGILMSARVVDSVLAATIKRQAGTDVDVIFYLLDRDDKPIVSGSTLGRGAGVDEILAKLPAPPREAPDRASAAMPEMRTEVELNGTHYVGLAGVLRSSTGSPIGGFVALRDRDAEFATYAAFQRTVLLTGAIGILFAAFLSWLVARQVTRPVAALVAATKRATEGDYSAEISSTSNDEIGSLAQAFRAMLGDLKEKQELVDFLGGAEQARTVQMRTMSITAEQQVMQGGLVPGSKFAGRYEVKEILGVGGMGMVFKAMDTELGELIAIKTLKRDFMSQDPSALERFKSEIRLARRISHRNVVRTHDLGENSGVYYITMEYVEGKSLKDLIRARGRLPLNVALSVGKQLARALEIAHEQGIIHRDIKPQNMVVEPDGVLKVMDFGIARLAARPNDGMTQAGMVVGTPEYMAPEQVTGGEIDARADIYAAGCVIYECLTGRPPLTAETPYQMVARLLEDTPEAPRTLNAEVPEALDQLVMRMLSKDPAGRPQTAAQLHDLLAHLG